MENRWSRGLKFKAGRMDKRLGLGICRLMIFVWLMCFSPRVWGQTEIMQWERFIDSRLACDLFSNDVVATDLELTDEQKEQLKEFVQKYKERYFEIRSRRLTTEDSIEQWLEVYENELLPEREGILLPFQVERLNQLLIQRKVATDGVDAGLLNELLKSELRLSTEQIIKIEEIARQASERIKKVRKDAATDYRNQLYSRLREFTGDLSPEQRQTFDRELGDLIRNKDGGMNDRP